ncbi:MAG: hypothetical protein GXP09_00245 [Gammaproteobacteria bacterium]|nr:hypothetical protein [Gammaproteobacteria bacterium]
MSYRNLILDLDHLGKLLKENINEVEGLTDSKLERAESKLSKDISLYISKVEAALERASSGIELAKEVLNTEDAKKLLKKAALRVIFTKAVGSTPKGNTVAQIRKELLEEVEELRNGEQVKYLVLEYINKSKKPVKLDTDDEDELRRRFIDLGSLSDEEFEYELDRNFKTIPAMKKLAKTNGMHIKPKTTKNALIKEIRHYSKRAYENML